MKTTAPPRPRAQGAEMTIRVYIVNRVGTITADTGTHPVPPEAGPIPARSGTYYPYYPPCAWPRHRAEVAR